MWQILWQIFFDFKTKTDFRECNTLSKICFNFHIESNIKLFCIFQYFFMDYCAGAAAATGSVLT